MVRDKNVGRERGDVGGGAGLRQKNHDPYFVAFLCSQTTD